MPLIKKTHKKSEFLYGITTEYEEPRYTDNKANRADELDHVVITVDGHLFDGDERSMDRIDRLIDVANFKYNKAIYDGVPQAQAYEEVYQQTMIPWKTNDNQFIQVNIETLAVVQEEALNQMSQLWVKWG